MLHSSLVIHECSIKPYSHSPKLTVRGSTKSGPLSKNITFPLLARSNLTSKLFCWDWSILNKTRLGLLEPATSKLQAASVTVGIPGWGFPHVWISLSLWVKKILITGFCSLQVERVRLSLVPNQLSSWYHPPNVKKTLSYPSSLFKTYNSHIINLDISKNH